MSGFCSAHRHYEPTCSTCVNTTPPAAKPPAGEEEVELVARVLAHMGSLPTEPDAELIARLREAEVDYTIEWGSGDIYGWAADCLTALAERVAALTRERDDLYKQLANAGGYIAEIAGFRDKCFHRAVSAEARCVAMERDAERYRWLRNADNWCEEGPMPMVATFDSTIYGTALDAAIDAARAEVGK
jgi:hypothetical protein